MEPPTRGEALAGLVLSQVASASTALATLFAKSLAGRGVVLPLTQVFAFYLALSVFLGLAALLRHCRRRARLAPPPPRVLERRPSAVEEENACGSGRASFELEGLPRRAEAVVDDEMDTADTSSRAPLAGAEVSARRISFKADDRGAARGAPPDAVPPPALLRRCAAAAQAPWPLGVVCCGTALCDVEANVLQVVAVRYSSMTTIVFLGSGGVLPAVLILGTFCLGHRYSKQHVLGAVAACVGFVFLVAADAWGAPPLPPPAEGEEAAGAGPPPEAASAWGALWGATLCGISALCFAASSLGQEALIQRGCSPAAVLRRVQPAAAVFAGVQALALGSHELPEFARVLRGGGAALSELVAFEAAVVVIYVAQPWIISIGGAAFFNLGLLMSNVYGAALAAALLGEPLGSPLKLCGGAAVFAGIVLYMTGPETAAAETQRPPEATGGCELVASAGVRSAA